MEQNHTQQEEDYIQHYGILGMHWGVRRTPEELGHTPRQQRKNRKMADDRGVLSNLGWSRSNKSKFEKKRFDAESTKSIHLRREAQRKNYRAAQLEEKALTLDKNMNPVVKKEFKEEYKRVSKESGDAWREYYKAVSDEAKAIFGDSYNKPMKDVHQHGDTYEQYYKKLVEKHSPNPWGRTRTYHTLTEDGIPTIGTHPTQNAPDSYLKKHFPEYYDEFKENFRIGAETRKRREIK